MGSSADKFAFKVWRTDYDNWMMRYRCSQGAWYNPFMLFGFAKSERFDMSTRDPVLSEELFDEIYDIVAEELLDFSIDGLYAITQGGDCEYSWQQEEVEEE